MDKTIAKLWVEKLRSGQFPQGTRFLCYKENSDEDKFCCLGVLCELYEELNPRQVLRDLYKEQSIEGNVVEATSFNNCLTVLPIQIKDWANMRSTNGEINEFLCLAELNDKGESFENIANLIENQVDVL